METGSCHNFSAPAITGAQLGATTLLHISVPPSHPNRG